MDNNSTIVLPLARPDFKPYLLQALLDWIEAQNFTPYILVKVDDACQVPQEFVNPDDTIVFCVSSEATNKFQINDESVSFQARFGESVRNIYLPKGRILAVYPKENTDLVSYFPLLETPDDVDGKNKDGGATDDDIPVFTKV